MDQGSAKYGYKYWIDQGGTLHTHMIHVKLDLDILGTKNTLAYDEVVVEKADYSAWDPLLPPAYRPRIKTTKVTNEAKAAFKLNPATPREFYIQNEKKLNKWGSPRGYKVMVEHYVHQIFPDDDPRLPGFSWTKNQLVATKRKENEPSSSTLFEQVRAALLSHTPPDIHLHRVARLSVL